MQLQIMPSPRKASAREIRAQEGPQRAFISCTADICIFGGSSGSGKSFSLVFDPIRYVDIKGFSAVMFRRTYPELVGGGSITEEAQKLYRLVGGKPKDGGLVWQFPSGASIQFSHLQRADSVYAHQSKQYAGIYFDEVTHFEESQFWYLLSRNRTTCDVRPYIRAATNPDPDSFVSKLIEWWIDQESGLPIPERSGVIRWFVRDGDELVWASEKAQLVELFGELRPLSLTFIAAKLSDNPILEAQDPGYRARLLALPKVERERLLYGNWKIKPMAGSYFRRLWFPVVEAAPLSKVTARVRAWDKAATRPHEGNRDPDWTVGVKLAALDDGTFIVEHVERLRDSPLMVERAIRTTAEHDGDDCEVCLWVDPGQAGKADIDHLTRVLAGFPIHAEVASKDKVSYARPVSSQVEAGNISVVRGTWNDAFLICLEAFDGRGKEHDDDVDALSLAFRRLSSSNGVGLV